MKQMRYLFAFAFLIQMINISSQNVGYMGKKLGLEANFNIMPSFPTRFASPGIIYKDNSGLFGKINFDPFLSVVYTFERNAQIGYNFGYDAMKSKMTESSINFNIDATSYTIYGIQELSQINGRFIPINEVQKVRFISNEIFINFYKKKRGYIAPVGLYHQIRFSRINMGFRRNQSPEGTLTSEQIPSEVLNELLPNYEFPIEKYTCNRFSYGIGKKIIVKDFIYINLMGSIGFGLFNFNKSGSRFNSLKASFINDINSQYLFQFKVGVGKLF